MSSSFASATKKNKKSSSKGRSGGSYVDLNAAQVNQNAYIQQVLGRVPQLVLSVFKNMYADAHAFTRSKEGRKENLSTQEVFKDALNKVREWGDDIISEETRTLISKVPWLKTALHQVLAIQVYIMLSVKNDRVLKFSAVSKRFEMPTDEEIVFHFIRHSVRSVRPLVKLFQTLDEGDYDLIEERIRESISRSIFTLVPIENILETTVVDTDVAYSESQSGVGVIGGDSSTSTSAGSSSNGAAARDTRTMQAVLGARQKKISSQMKRREKNLKKFEEKNTTDDYYDDDDENAVVEDDEVDDDEDGGGIVDDDEPKRKWF